MRFFLQRYETGFLRNRPLFLSGGPFFGFFIVLGVEVDLLDFI
jgi:hypothetical protein